MTPPYVRRPTWEYLLPWCFVLSALVKGIGRWLWLAVVVALVATAFISWQHVEADDEGLRIRDVSGWRRWRWGEIRAFKEKPRKHVSVVLPRGKERYLPLVTWPPDELVARAQAAGHDVRLIPRKGFHVL